MDDVVALIQVFARQEIKSGNWANTAKNRFPKLSKFVPWGRRLIRIGPIFSPVSKIRIVRAKGGTGLWDGQKWAPKEVYENRFRPFRPICRGRNEIHAKSERNHAQIHKIRKTRLTGGLQKCPKWPSLGPSWDQVGPITSRVLRYAFKSKKH